jgi:hypothetical protein
LSSFVSLFVLSFSHLPIAVLATGFSGSLFRFMTHFVVINRRSQLRSLPTPTSKWTPNEKKEQKRGYLMKVLETVVDNVHVTISNLRLRYEDAVGPAPPCAFDFTISRIEVSTTDEKGVPLFAQLQNIVYKAVCAQNVKCAFVHRCKKRICLILFCCNIRFSHASAFGRSASVSN